MLYEANLGKQFWAEAINCACYLRNRSAVSNQDKTPYEMFFNYKPDLSHVRIFGSVATSHVPKKKRRKWNAKSEKMILVGFSENGKGYRLYNPKTGEVTTSRYVHIIEHEPRNTHFYVEPERERQKIRPSC